MDYGPWEGGPGPTCSKGIHRRPYSFNAGSTMGMAPASGSKRCSTTFDMGRGLGEKALRRMGKITPGQTREGGGNETEKECVTVAVSTSMRV